MGPSAKHVFGVQEWSYVVPEKNLFLFFKNSLDTLFFFLYLEIFVWEQLKKAPCTKKINFFCLCGGGLPLILLHRIFGLSAYRYHNGLHLICLIFKTHYTITHGTWVQSETN